MFPVALLSGIDSHPEFISVQPEVQVQYLLIKWLSINVKWNT